MCKKWAVCVLLVLAALSLAQQPEPPGFSFGKGQTKLPIVVEEMDVATIRTYDPQPMQKFAKAWFSFRENHTLTDDGMLVPSVNGSDPCPDSKEAQVAFLHYLAKEPVKVTIRHSVKCEDCRGTGKKYVYDGLSPTELTHTICGGTGRVDSLVICRLSYSATPPPRLPSANQKAYQAALKLAEGGEAKAALDVGSRLASGRGIGVDVSMASKWYVKALVKGEAKAACELALLYERGGVGFEMNKPFAVALAMLGRDLGAGEETLSQLGRSVSPMDMLKGQWFGQHLSRLQKSGSLDAATFGPKLVEKAALAKFSDVLAAARRDDRLATFEVGMIQLCGLGAGGMDAIAAYGWFARSAKAGNALAYYALGAQFEAGVATKQSRPAAFVMYKAAVALGQEFPSAQSAKQLEPYCSDAAISAKVDEVLLKLKTGGMGGSELSLLAALPDVAVPIAATLPTGASDALGQEDDTRRRQPIMQSGSGMIFTHEGHVFTNHHVVDKCSYFTVLMNGAKTERLATLVCVDQAHDLAILKIYGWKGASEVPYALPSLLRSAKEEARLGMRVFTIGYPEPLVLNFAPKYTSGDLNSLEGVPSAPHFLQMSCPIQHGNSGGPLVLEDGRVAGVVCAGFSPGKLQNVNFAVRIEFLRELACRNAIDIPAPSVRTQYPIPVIQAHSVQILCRK